MKILGVCITSETPQKINELIASYLGTPGFHRVTTVNPEFLVRAEQDERFRTNLNKADVSVPDGVGVVWAGRLRGKRVYRYPGADLMATILRIANERRLPVFLAVRGNGLSSYEEVRASILKKYPGVIITGSDISAGKNLESRISNLVSNFQLPASSIVFCNFGAPDQEYFCEALRTDPGEVRLAVGVGGAFDFLTGKRKRAPKWMRAVGIEWLWRFFLQPKRYRRILDAVVVFPWLVVRDRLRKKERG